MSRVEIISAHLSQMFNYPFIVKALVVGILVSLCAALLGVSLVLKRYSMIGDGLSHAGFGSLAIASALNAAPLSVSIPLVVAAAFLLLRLSENSKIQGDAAIALVSTASLAIGVIIISQTTGMNTDVCNYLFGSILAMSRADVYLSAALAAVVLVLFVLFYNRLFSLTFDEGFMRAAGIKAGLYNMLIAFLTAITIVLGMRMMGAMLISSLIVFPALTSMRLLKTFRSVTVCSAVVSVACFFAGVVISYIYAVPTGASVVMMNIAAFSLFWIAGELFTGKTKMISGGKGKKEVLKKAALLIVCVFLTGGCEKIKNLSPKKNRAGTVSVSLGAETADNAAISPRKPDDGQNIVPGDDVPAEPSAPENQAAKNAPSKVVEIGEKMFIAQTNDIYLNPEDYLGKTIKLEGIFQKGQYDGDSAAYCFVFRYGPGCCGGDGNAGFEVAWNDPDPAYPEIDAWVEAVGTLKTYEEDGYPYLYIALSSLTVLSERGKEFVTQ